MFQNKQIHTDVIVFSQWSRKNYAVFASLKKVIRIARLSIDICQSSLLKTPTVIHLLSLLGLSNIENDDTNTYEQIDNLLLSFAVMPTISNSKDIYSQNKLINYNTGNPYFAKCKVWVFLF